MNSVLLLRLFLDLVAAGLLVFDFSYWWLGNAAHEAAGTAMFLLIIVHNVLNRRFYGSLNRTRRDVRSLFNVAVTLALMLAMLAPLVTSVLISNTLAPIMSAFGGFTIRQIHTLAAYWALVIVAVHLGLRWPMIMDVARNLGGITRSSAVRTDVIENEFEIDPRDDVEEDAARLSRMNQTMRQVARQASLDPGDGIEL